jgi:protein-disulfide isomerase
MTTESESKSATKKSSSKGIILIALIIFLVGFGTIIIDNYQSITSLKSSNQKISEQNSQDEFNKEINEVAENKEDYQNNAILEIKSSDYILGNKFAPVTIIEYASLSCPHCASFVEESFGKINEEYIKTGKVKFIYRDFPLNQPALTAAIFAKCQAQENQEDLPEKYYNTIKALFKTQDSWAFTPEFINRLKAIAKLDGMNEEVFEKCINNKNLQREILSKRMEAAQELRIESTPSFFINGEVSKGYIDHKTLKTLIDKKLKEAKQNF